MNKIENDIERLKSMMRSCFAYHSLWKSNKYISKYVDILGIELFTKTYDNYKLYLEKTYTIKSNVYTDGEGCTYNEMIKK